MDLLVVTHQIPAKVRDLQITRFNHRQLTSQLWE